MIASERSPRKSRASRFRPVPRAVMYKAATAFLLTAVVVGSPWARAATEPSFVGIWYSAGQPDEPGVMSLIEFKADGTFREEFRKCEKGEIVGFQVQSGIWTVADGIERTITNMINGEKANVEDTYRIELLTDTQRRIRMQGRDYVFTSLRVSKFEFPDCASGA
jgi:hypothetical protein